MDNNQEVAEVNKGTPRWLVPAVVILAIVSIAGLGFAWYDSNQLQMAQQASGQLKTAEQNTTQRVATLEQKQEQADATSTELRSLGVVAAQVRDEDAQKLARLDTDLKNQLATKASTYELNKHLTTVNGNVNGVKTDLEGTKNDLKMARSELGTLIARNHEDVEQLRRLGERDYIEFTIDAKNKPQKVGAFMVELRGTNLNKKRYSVSLIIDDVHIDKKNLPVNEPVFFHQGNDRRPLEMVVNQVGKDKVTGYISIPKAAGAQTASGD